MDPCVRIARQSDMKLELVETKNLTPKKRKIYLENVRLKQAG